jgi:membrane protein YqaA with SNARE-associated domain
LLDGISDIIHGLMDWVTHFAYTPYGEWALFGIAFAESSFFPIPPDVLLMALAVARPEGSLWFATICTAASVLGGIFGYWLGNKGGRPLMHKLFSKEKIAVVERYYQKWDVWAVGAAGLTPLPYKVFTISAGVFNLSFPRFLLASVISRAARFYAVGILFWLYGKPIQAFIKEYFGILTLAFFVLLFGGFYVIKVMGKKAAQGGGEKA